MHGCREGAGAERRGRCMDAREGAGRGRGRER